MIEGYQKEREGLVEQQGKLEATIEGVKQGNERIQAFIGIIENSGLGQRDCPRMIKKSLPTRPVKIDGQRLQ